MTTLADLFTDDDRTSVAVDVAVVEDSVRLEALFSEPRVTASPIGTGDARALARLVGGRASATSIQGGPAPAPASLRKGRVGWDWLSIVVSVIAVVLVVAAGAVVAVNVANASPAAAALSALTQSEAALGDRIETVNRSVDLAESARTDAVSKATALGPPLATLAGMSDEGARQAAEAARVQLLTTASGLALPGPLASYRRPAVDVKSLESVGAAIDAVEERATEVETVAAGLREPRRALDEANDLLAGALNALVAGIPGAAATIVAENPDAEESFHAAVSSTAQTLSTSDLLSSAGLSAIDAYSAAVTALRDEQARVAQALAEELERERLDDVYYGGSGSGGTDSGGGVGSGETETGGGTTDGGAVTEPETPVEPTTPEQPPTTPEASDPGTTG